MKKFVVGLLTFLASFGASAYQCSGNGTITLIGPYSIQYGGTQFQIDGGPVNGGKLIILSQAQTTGLMPAIGLHAEWSLGETGNDLFCDVTVPGATAVISNPPVVTGPTNTVVLAAPIPTQPSGVTGNVPPKVDKVTVNYIGGFLYVDSLSDPTNWVNTYATTTYTYVGRACTKRFRRPAVCYNAVLQAAPQNVSTTYGITFGLTEFHIPFVLTGNTPALLAVDPGVSIFGSDGVEYLAGTILQPGNYELRYSADVQPTAIGSASAYFTY